MIETRVLVSALLLLSLDGAVAQERRGAQSAAVECPSVQWMPERLDYYSPGDQLRIGQIESNHFDAETEALTRGKTGSAPGYDIEFLVRYVPNHPRGLAALVRLSLREKTPRPVGVSQSVECYLLRALEFRAEDAEVQKLYGSYLARLGRHKEALTHLKLAESYAPNDAVISYNLGLVCAELRDYEQARTYARKAYAGGISLPGLRDKLAKAGQWRD